MNTSGGGEGTPWQQMASDLRELVAEIENDRSLYDPSRLRERVEAIDSLEAYLQDIEDEADAAGNGVEPGLASEAQAAYDRLEAINSRLFQAIRDDIQGGAGAGRMLQIAADRGEGLPASGRSPGESYDYLDTLVSGVLQFEQPASEIAPLAAEMVFYQPSPARHIFNFIGRAALTERDVLVDLGSGLGHVPLLVAICTPARGAGVEIEAAYVDCARRSASALNVRNATFIQQDVREADLSYGTVFYMHTPFTGSIMRSVLDSLHEEAAKRDIRICALGACALTIAEERWLEPDGPVSAGRPVIFTPNLNGQD